MISIPENHQSKLTWLTLVVVCVTCSFTLISCNSATNSLMFGDNIEVTIPEEFKYDSDNDAYILNDCSMTVSYDSIIQPGAILPKNNFNNTMNVIETDKKLLHEEIIENEGLKLGIKEVLDKQNNISYLIFTEVQDHLLLINCHYKNADRDIYLPKVQMVVSSIRPLG